MQKVAYDVRCSAPALLFSLYILEVLLHQYTSCKKDLMVLWGKLSGSCHMMENLKIFEHSLYFLLSLH